MHPFTTDAVLDQSQTLVLPGGLMEFDVQDMLCRPSSQN